MVDIFITHIHEDEIVARGLHRFLQAKLRGTSARVFLSSDPTQLRLGDDWLRKIQEALKSAKLVLAIFSEESVNRPWVNFEAGGAWFVEGKTLIPLCVGDIRPESLPKPYSNIQGAHLEEESSLWYLVQAIWDVFSWPGTSPPPFSQDDEDVAQFNRDLEWWDSQRRAEKAAKRRSQPRDDSSEG
jgi:hypothetical protein